MRRTQLWREAMAVISCGSRSGVPSRQSFSLGRSGQVLASRLAGSSGHAALDGETLAMVRRAQPFPAFPPDMKQGSMSFDVPIQFSIR